MTETYKYSVAHTQSNGRALRVESPVVKLLNQYYRGPIRRGDQGFVIRCPWHEDRNPSCNIYLPSGVFFCWACHQGGKGQSPLAGFRALGAPEDVVQEAFKACSSSPSSKLPSERILTPDEVRDRQQDQQQFDLRVVTREPWPEGWGFRGVPSAVMHSPSFKARFAPTLVRLRHHGTDTERYPRLALKFGEKAKHEVYLRLSSEQQPKAINSKGLEQKDPETMLFGLGSWRLDPEVKGLVLVEGPYDCLHLYQAFHRLQTPFEVVALCGTSQWAHVRDKLELYLLPQLLKRNLPLLLAFDHDEAGLKVTRLALKDLLSPQALSLSRQQLGVVPYPQNKKDPGELTLDDVKEAFSQWTTCK